MTVCTRQFNDGHDAIMLVLACKHREVHAMWSAAGLVDSRCFGLLQASTADIRAPGDMYTLWVRLAVLFTPSPEDTTPLMPSGSAEKPAIQMLQATEL